MKTQANLKVTFKKQTVTDLNDKQLNSIIGGSNTNHDGIFGTLSDRTVSSGLCEYGADLFNTSN